MSDGALASAVFSSRTSCTDDLTVFGSTGSVAVSLYRFDGYERASPGTVAGDAGARVRAALAAARELPGAFRDVTVGRAARVRPTAA